MLDFVHYNERRTCDSLGLISLNFNSDDVADIACIPDVLDDGSGFG